MVVLGVLRLEAAMAEWMGGVRCGGGMLPDGICRQGQGQHLATMAEWMGFASTYGKSKQTQALLRAHTWPQARLGFGISSESGVPTLTRVPWQTLLFGQDKTLCERVCLPLCGNAPDTPHGHVGISWTA